MLSGDGALSCWGRDRDETPGGSFATVGVGHREACAVSPGGQVQCWGDGADPLQGGPQAAFTAVAVGHAFACGIGPDSTLSCWGANGDHQTEPPLGRYVAVSAGARHACGLDVDGTVSCWGDNRDGQAMSPPDHFVALTCGGRFNCGVKEGGELHCWGKQGRVTRNVPRGDFVDVVAGSGHACALRADQTAVCWGDDSDGQGSAPGGRFYALAAGEVHSCGIRYPTGKIECWGNDYHGESSPARGEVKLPDGVPVQPPARAAGGSYRQEEDDGRSNVSFGKVVVLGLHSVDGDDDHARAMSYGLREASSRVAGYAIGDEKATGQQLELAHDCVGLDRACLQEIAKNMQAAAIVYGTMRRDRAQPGARRIVELHIFEALSGDITGSTKQAVTPAQLKRPALLQRSEAILRALHEASR